ncbi:MAG: putative lipid II flippase FtsW [Candidatus Latescibacterota bacterium]|nr:putative lipid II flippase FtsW [Candidatus Latescibacterota bacterium]
MSNSSPAERAARQVLLIAVVLVGIGVVMVYSSSSALAGTRFHDAGFFLHRQLLRAAFGLLIMFAISRVPLGWWRRLARPLLIGVIGLLVLVLLFGEGKGAQRWLPFRLPMAQITFQPSEFAKLVLVLYLADVMVRHRELMTDWQHGLLPRLLIIAIVLGLIVLQPDLGTALAIGTIALLMLWIGGARPAHLACVGIAGLPVIMVSVLTSPYQLQRLLTFFGDADPQGAGFQIAQAELALGSGGWVGVGLGNSMQKYFLPEPHTDFVFAFAGEELGLFGTLSIIGLFIALALHGFRIAAAARSDFGFYTAAGVTMMISVYALLNVAVATGLAPTTGLPLPFISYGGSALLWNLCGLGILSAVAREQEDKSGMRAALSPVTWRPAADHRHAHSRRRRRWSVLSLPWSPR